MTNPGVDLRLYVMTAPNTLGYSAAAHAAKLPAWTLRLRAASHGLALAVRRRNRPEAVRLLEDVWFWIGRITGEAMAAAELRRHARGATRAQAEVQRAYVAIYAARAFLRRTTRS